MYTFIVGGLLAVIYLAINLLLPVVPADPNLKTYLVQPLLWGLFILAMRLLPGYRTLAKYSLKSFLFRLALGLGIFQIVLYVFGGLFSGFGKNPASLTPLGIIQNLVFIGSLLVAMEMGRAWLVTRGGKRHSVLAIAVVTIVFTFLSIPLNQFTGFKWQMESVNQVVSLWVPLLAESLLASWLAYLSGARVSLAYRGLLAAFWWFCPILPDLTWSLKGLIGAAAPVLGMVAVSSIYFKQAYRGKSHRRARKASFPAGWVITELACLVIIWFAVGIFPIQPSVVPTGSMLPGIQPGDMVIIAKAPAGSVKVGDVIEYRNVNEKINIIHRVIDIQGDGSQKYFITKGDNNKTPDVDPVPAQNVVGKVVFNVPKIGWVSLGVKNLISAGS